MKSSALFIRHAWLFHKSILLVTHGYYISLLRIQFYSHRDNYHLCVNNRRCRHHMESYNPVHTPLSYTLEKRIKRSFISKFFCLCPKNNSNLLLLVFAIYCHHWRSQDFIRLQSCIISYIYIFIKTIEINERMCILISLTQVKQFIQHTKL